MIRLNLEAKNKAEEKIKEYLENNASELLAGKINNGVKIQKDNKTLNNKKTLDAFMKCACEEARKLAEKGANSACIEDDIVYGWAIHYFEENDIIGELYNEDGTIYQSPVSKPQITKIEQPKKVENKQPTLFDLMIEKEEKIINENKNVKKIQENVEKIEKNVQKTENNNEKIDNNSNLIIFKDKIVDKDTGEILNNLDYENSIHKQSMYKFYSLLNGKIEIQ